MTDHEAIIPAPVGGAPESPAAAQPPLSRWARWRSFWKNSEGQVLIEYVLLVVGVFVSVNVTVQPFKNALKVFAKDIIEHVKFP